MSGQEFRRYVLQAQADLQQAFSTALSQDNNGGSSCSGGTTIALSTLGVERASLVQSGELTVNIPLPNGTSFVGTTFSDVRVFLVAPSPAADGSPVLSVEATKAGSSVLLDRHGVVRRFAHE